MIGQPGFFDVGDRLRELSAKGDDLERIAALVDFEMFRPELERAVPRSDGTKGGRPAFDRVLMFKVLLLQARQTNSHAPVSRKHCSREILQRHEVQMSPLRSRPGSHAD